MRPRLSGQRVTVRLAALAVVVALALAGCGGDDGDGDEPAGGGPPTPAPETQPERGTASDEAAIRSTMTTYIKAVAAGDGETACSQLTDNGRRVAASAPGAKSDTCEDVIAEIGAAFKPADKERLRNVKAEQIEVRLQGDRATAHYRDASQTAELVRSRERWLIDDYGARPGARNPGEPPEADVDSVPFARVEQKLREALAKRYSEVSHDCPESAQLKVGEQIECEVTADGKSGTAKLELKPKAYLSIQIDVGGRLSFSQSQVSP